MHHFMFGRLFPCNLPVRQQSINQASLDWSPKFGAIGVFKLQRGQSQLPRTLAGLKLSQPQSGWQALDKLTRFPGCTPVWPLQPPLAAQMWPAVSGGGMQCRQSHRFQSILHFTAVEGLLGTVCTSCCGHHRRQAVWCLKVMCSSKINTSDRVSNMLLYTSANPTSVFFQALTCHLDMCVTEVCKRSSNPRTS